MEFENQTRDQLIATIEQLNETIEQLDQTIKQDKTKLEATQAMQERDADKLETLSEALMSIMEDKVNELIESKIGPFIDDELENRDLVSRYDFNDLFDDALSEVEVTVSR